MAEPTTPIITITAAGITVFSVATGLHPGMLIAGLAGGLWAMSYQPPAGVLARAAFLGLSAMVAGYLAPVLTSIAASAAGKLLTWWPEDVTQATMQFPVAFVIGFLALRWLGPALLRRAEKLEGSNHG